MDGMEFEVNFTDVTMLEANGEYAVTVEIMSKPYKIAGGITTEAFKEWVVKSDVTIKHALGFSIVQCDFYHNGKVIITDYKPSSKDIYVPDIRCLTAWAQSYGWSVPEPSPIVIESWKDFWKIQWETYIVNSYELDRKFGERSASTFGEDYDDDDDIYDDDIDKYRKDSGNG